MSAVHDGSLGDTDPEGDEFNPIPLATLALASTAVTFSRFLHVFMSDTIDLQIYCALREWATGKFSSIPFEVVRFKGIYGDIMEFLESKANGPRGGKDRKKIGAIQKKIAQDGMRCVRYYLSSWICRTYYAA